MKLYSKKEIIYAVCFVTLLLGFMLYAFLDTFVIPREYEVVEDEDSVTTAAETDSISLSSGTETQQPDSAITTAQLTETAAVTEEIKPNSDTYYHDDNITVSLTEYREYETVIYVADVRLASIDYLKTAFANNRYGKNVTAKTSDTAAAHSAVLAVNGDYYGARTSGYVLRNGKVYRSTVLTSSGKRNEDLAIMSDGSFNLIREGDISADALKNAGALQVFSFGPWLISDGKILVSESDEVGKAMASNPRTALGQYSDEPFHYVFLVSDGRTGESDGLSLYQLAVFMQKLGVTTAYNLDGGGSSTMYFNGRVVNNPTTNGKISERSVSDIVYIGN